MIKDLNLENFDEFVNNSSACIIDFWAPWCGPCRMQGPVLDEIAKELNVNIGKVNCDDNEELCVRFNITAIPHLFVFKDGKQVHDFLGFTGKETLITSLK